MKPAEIFKPVPILLSLLAGLAAAWWLREPWTQWLLSGRTFAARSPLVQLALLASLTLLIAAIFLVLLAQIGRLSQAPLEHMRRAAPRSGAFLAERLAYLSDALDRWFTAGLSAFTRYVRKNTSLIVVLSLIALGTYSFELFNLNLSIDEEIAARFTSPNLQWVAQGRWGMYLLNKFLLPYNVIPVVPLGLALLFLLAAMLILIDCWGIRSRPQQMVVGAVGIAFPGTAFIYSFSTINYGAGIGFFLTALSLAVFVRTAGWRRLWAALPGMLAVSIYQPFILALVVVYLVYLISLGLRGGEPFFKELFSAAALNVLFLLLYFLFNRLFLALYSTSLSSYVTEVFNLSALADPRAAWDQFRDMLTRVYSGDQSLYSIHIGLLPALLVVSVLGFLASLSRLRAPLLTRLLLLLCLPALLGLPLVSGPLTSGFYDMRFLLGLPVGIAGMVMLGMEQNPVWFRTLIGALALFCVFQFMQSANHLFAASHLALQEDRLLASSLVERIESARGEGAAEPKYLEISGIPVRPATPLIPKISIFGASFFEWDQGNTNRVLFFMQTLGYQGLLPRPAEGRAAVVAEAESMPDWPAQGSVRILDDTVIIKFGPYSDQQKARICSQIAVNERIEYKGFCSP